MAPRPRSRKHSGLPTNLYVQRGYYTYRNPETGKTYGLGRDKAIAVTQAVEANMHLQKQAVTLLDRITGAAEKTVNDWCDVYGDHRRIKLLREGLGHHVLAKLEPSHINDWLDRWNNKPRMRQAMLSAAKVVFGAAIGKGWIATNPAEKLKTPPPQTQRERLTLETFMAIYAVADRPLQRAMELALMTGARRENVLLFQRSDVRDGYLYVAHIKGGLQVRIPLSMYLPAVGWTLGDVIGRCKTAVVSKYLIHHLAHAGVAKPGDKYRDKTIEQLFREARDKAGIVSEHPPTFHEIRSLAARLWDAAGVNAKALLGHRTERMAALYKDSRGAEWVTISG